MKTNLKSIFAMMILMFSMLACSAETLPGYVNPAVPKNIAVGTPSRIASGTPMPSATIGYQQTADAALTQAASAQETAAAAQIIVAQITAGHESRELERTLSENAVEIAAQQAYLGSINATASAYPTSVSVTLTAQSDKNGALATDNYFKLTEATRITANARARTYDEYAEEIQSADLVMNISLSIMMVALAMLTLAIAAVRLAPLFKPPPPPLMVMEEEYGEDDLIPLVIDDRDKAAWNAVRADIPCSLAALLEFADGIINRRLTTGINVWEENGVLLKDRNVLRSIKNWMVQVRTEKGERYATRNESTRTVDMLDIGKVFLRSCLEHGHPPAPFRCVG